MVNLSKYKVYTKHCNQNFPSMYRKMFALHLLSFVCNSRCAVVNSPAVLRTAIILTIRHRHLPTTSNNHFSQKHLVPFSFHIGCRVSSTRIACCCCKSRYGTRTMLSIELFPRYCIHGYRHYYAVNTKFGNIFIFRNAEY